MLLYDLFENLSYGEAEAIFTKYNGQTKFDDLDQLKRIRNHLVKEYHPDRGGNLSIIQNINAAYEHESSKRKSIK